MEQPMCRRFQAAICKGYSSGGTPSSRRKQSEWEVLLWSLFRGTAGKINNKLVKWTLDFINGEKSSKFCKCKQFKWFSVLNWLINKRLQTSNVHLTRISPKSYNHTHGFSLFHCTVCASGHPWQSSNDTIICGQRAFQVYTATEIKSTRCKQFT